MLAEWAVAFGLLVLALRWPKHLDFRLAAACLAVASLAVRSSSAYLASYVPPYLGGRLPMADAELAVWDAWLGFSWHSYFIGQVKYSVVATITGLCYVAGPLLTVVIAAALIGAHQLTRSAQMLAAMSLTLSAAYAIACWVPTAGAYGYYKMSAADHPGVDIHYSYFEQVYEQLRTGSIDPYLAAIPVGTIGFPSFHTALVVIAVWGARPLPYRALFNTVQLVCLLGIPVHGLHWLSDMIAGALVAAVSLVLTSAMMTYFVSRNLARCRVSFAD
jgi:hypothetical protein